MLSGGSCLGLGLGTLIMMAHFAEHSLHPRGYSEHFVCILPHLIL